MCHRRCGCQRIERFLLIGLFGSPVRKEGRRLCGQFPRHGEALFDLGAAACVKLLGQCAVIGGGGVAADGVGHRLAGRISCAAFARADDDDPVCNRALRHARLVAAGAKRGGRRRAHRAKAGDRKAWKRGVAAIGWLCLAARTNADTANARAQGHAAGAVAFGIGDVAGR